MNKTLSGHLQELKNKGKVRLDNLKRGCGSLQEWSVMQGLQILLMSGVSVTSTSQI